MTSETTRETYELVVPSAGSTAAFVGVVLLVVVAYLAIFIRSYRGTENGRRAPMIAGGSFIAWIVVAITLASSGALRQLIGSPALMLYLVVSNGLALALALSPAGGRIVDNVPVAWLVGFQAFRLPLELVLHAWYEQGTLPIQMTYAGHNFDIATGVLALGFGAALRWFALGPTSRRWMVLAFNLIGFALLMAVMSIAVRSTPWPLRTYENDPPVLLVFYAPYTLILPVCVAGALWGHILVFRWLWRHRAQPG